MKSNQLKDRLQRQFTAEVEGRVPDQLVRHALSEAEALAWSTSFPLLFLPVLAEEKLDSARRWASRQREILQRKRAISLAE